MLLERRAFDEGRSNVAFAMDYNDAADIMPGGEDAFDPAEFSKTGLTAILVPPGEDGYDHNLITGIRNSGMAAGLLPGDADCAVYTFEYANTGSDFPVYIADFLPAGHELLSGSGIIMALPENSYGELDTRRYEGYAGDYIRSMTLRTVLNRAKDGSYDLSEAEEAVMESVIERGVRVVIITPFTGKDANIISDLSVYKTLIEELTKLLNKKEFTVSPEIHGAAAAYDWDGLSLLSLSLGLSAVLLLLVDRIKMLGLKLRGLMLLVFVIISVLLWQFLRPVCQEAAAFIAYTALPCLAVSFLMSRARTMVLSNGSRSVSSVFFFALGSVSIAAVLSFLGAVLGCLAVTAGNQAYGFAEYRFAAASYIVVFIWLAVQMFRSVYLEKGTPVSDYFASVFYWLGHKKARTVAIAFLLIIALTLWYYVANYYDSTVWKLWISLLERNLPAVPQSAQYLVGYPAAVLSLVLLGRRMRAGAGPFMLISFALPCSIISGFSSASITASYGIRRFVLSFVFGIIASSIVAGIASLIIKLIKLKPAKGWKV